MRNGQNNSGCAVATTISITTHHHRNKNQNPMSRVFESNGPDVKIRGNPSHIAEKYVQLARDAQSSGDPVAAENYYQHAEHYNRLIAAAQEQFRQQNPQFNNRPETDMRSDMRDDTFEDGDEDSAATRQPAAHASRRRRAHAYGTREPQPYLPREAQPFPQAQPAARSRSRQQPGSNRMTTATSIGCRRSSPAGSRSSGGQQPARAGQNGHDGQPDRFPLHRRRRRHRGPRGFPGRPARRRPAAGLI